MFKLYFLSLVWDGSSFFCITFFGYHKNTRRNVEGLEDALLNV
jgi:hypothetical protein